MPAPTLPPEFISEVQSIHLYAEVTFWTLLCLSVLYAALAIARHSWRPTGFIAALVTLSCAFASENSIRSSGTKELCTRLKGDLLVTNTSPEADIRLSRKVFDSPAARYNHNFWGGELSVSIVQEEVGGRTSYLIYYHWSRLHRVLYAILHRHSINDSSVECGIINGKKSP